MTWTVVAQLTSGTLTLSPTDKVWFNGVGGAYGTGVILGQHPDGAHISDQNDVHRCTSAHVHSTKFLDSSHVSIDGAGSASLPIPAGSCGLKFTFTNTTSVATSAALFYAYDGTTDANPVSGIVVQAAEGDQSSSWSNANGANNALRLTNQSTAQTHDFSVAVSVSPSVAGARAGKFKLVLTYV